LVCLKNLVKILNEEAGIVVEVTDRPRNKVFLATEVLRLTEDPKPPETGGET